MLYNVSFEVGMNEIVEIKLGKLSTTPMWWQHYIHERRAVGLTHVQIHEDISKIGAEYIKWDMNLEYAVLRFPPSVYVMFLLRWG